MTERLAPAEARRSCREASWSRRKRRGLRRRRRIAANGYCISSIRSGAGRRGAARRFSAFAAVTVSSTVWSAKTCAGSPDNDDAERDAEKSGHAQ